MLQPLKILLVDHDKDMASITKNFLVSRGYSVIICYDGDEALHFYNKELLDLVLINVDIPIISGPELVKEIKKKGGNVPIILFGTSPRHDTVLKALKSGADEFLARPISMEELGLRIEILYKKSKEAENKKPIYIFGNYILDCLHHVLIFNKDSEKKLTPKEYDLFVVLCQYMNRIVERSKILGLVWKSDNYFNARSLDVYISKLRKKIRNDPHVKIENVHGVGYRLVVYS